MSLCVCIWSKAEGEIPAFAFHFGMFLRLKNHSSLSFQCNNFEVKKKNCQGSSCNKKFLFFSVLIETTELKLLTDLVGRLKASYSRTL